MILTCVRCGAQKDTATLMVKVAQQAGAYAVPTAEWWDSVGRMCRDCREQAKSYHFDGETYEPGLDKVRLNSEMRAVFRAMADGDWRTFDEIQVAALHHGGKLYPHPSISARLRDFRKERFGSHTVERRRRDDPQKGLWEYRLLVRREELA